MKNNIFENSLLPSKSWGTACLFLLLLRIKIVSILFNDNNKNNHFTFNKHTEKTFHIREEKKKNTLKKQDVEEVLATEHQGRADTWKERGATSSFLFTRAPLPVSLVMERLVKVIPLLFPFALLGLCKMQVSTAFFFFYAHLAGKQLIWQFFFYTFKFITSIIILITPLFKFASKL